MLCFVNVGIYIKRRRKPPPARGQNEAVVSQVIIPITNSDIEGNAPKELLEIGRNVGARSPSGHSQQFWQVEIFEESEVLIPHVTDFERHHPSPRRNPQQALYEIPVEQLYSREGCY